MRGHGSQWFSHKMQLKKSKSWEPFWSYQLNSTANPAHLLGVDYSFYVKIIEIHAHAFFKVIIFSIGSVLYVYYTLHNY